ncbi:cytochrome c1 [Enterovirga aerilata]|uniref:Cytochrome c1 n=1 Tax=Enterovirga aerilata TaxID=2730920 RepID=A0A849I5P6_9HYPH|nr:cytochrome c1 [Enterovirga sp. DB1703]NNM71655.1 cytochrome c1 [Enterovirga sp. DB1703]
MNTRHALLAAALAVGTLAGAATVQAAEGTPNPPRQSWTFAGVFGTFDRAQLQRGFKVYREVCQACHQLKIPFRTLAQNGGPQFSVAQVTALAAEYKVQDGPNDAGEMFERPGRPADFIPPPFPNENAAAAANGGKAPPPLQVIAKARGFERGFPWFIVDVIPFLQYQEHGPDYIHALLTGYEEPPAGFTVPPGGHYNKYFPGHVIAMPNPLSDGQVEYPKGPDGRSPVPETVEQYSKDLAAFLMWTAEPALEQRKRMGFMVIIFLAVFSYLMYYVKKKVWAQVGGEAEGAPGTAPLGPTG